VTIDGSGTSLDLATCESEPIRIPGSIQPHGVLLALDPTTLVIEQVSENSERLLGMAPADLIGKLPAAFLGERQFERLAIALRSPSFETDGTNVTISPQREPMECLSSRYRDALLLEFQPVKGAHALDLLDVSLSLHAPLSRMERSASVEDLVGVVAKEIRAISGFERAMVYRFDDDWHGVVLAEDVGDRFPVSYLGLHFPAADIPAQARDLYLLNTLRLIPDIDYVPVAIVPAENARLRAPLDLSRSNLRSVSPIHIEYLRNIGVRATLTISIIVRGKLWGLVACHHDSPRRLSHVVRSTCNFFARMLALKLTARIEHAELAQRLDASEKLARFVADLETTQTLLEAARRCWAQLLPIFAADALFVRGPDGCAVYGTALSPADLQPAIARLEEAARDGIASSSSLCSLADNARRFAAEVSGALYVGLSANDNRCLVILRREQSARVTWAGDPKKTAFAEPGKGRLSPRSSFAAWEEITHGESHRWSTRDIEKAASLREQLMDWQQAREEVRLLPHYDALTELPNRRLLDELLQRSLNEAAAKHKLVGLLFIDVDRFKRFNERLGRSTGDRVLRHVAARISRAVREGDIVGRLGGDEFIVIMPAMSDRAAAQRIAQRLLDEVSQPMPGIEGPDLRATLSIGISLYPTDAATSEALLSTADAAMYRVKQSGRSAWQSYASEQTGSASDAAERSVAIAQALDRSEIVAHFQPIVDLAGGGVLAVEALARWNHPVSGLLGPGAFIEVAETTDLIVRLGEAMLDQSCREVRQWRRTSAPDLRVAVNVSPRQLRDFGFVQTVRRTLERYKLPAAALELEITEGMMAGDTSQSITALRELAADGVRIAIDDFGTGYSSFNYLRRLPVKTLKIDQSFVAELNAPETLVSGTEIIRAIISVAKSLGLEVVGEGVETQAQFDLLRASGCNYAQGYHIGRPLTAAAYAAFSPTAVSGRA
jgi:diguanylate cyclase (GGDEF)-like protein